VVLYWSKLTEERVVDDFRESVQVEGTYFWTLSEMTRFLAVGLMEGHEQFVPPHECFA
jgi:hypothetical protein